MVLSSILTEQTQFELVRVENPFVPLKLKKLGGLGCQNLHAIG